MSVFWNITGSYGLRSFDFRTGSDPFFGPDDPKWQQWRVYVYFRKSDGKIVSLEYWKLGGDETFSREEIRYLKALSLVGAILPD